MSYMIPSCSKSVIFLVIVDRINGLFLSGNFYIFIIDEKRFEQWGPQDSPVVILVYIFYRSMSQIFLITLNISNAISKLR